MRVGAGVPGVPGVAEAAWDASQATGGVAVSVSEGGVFPPSMNINGMLPTHAMVISPPMSALSRGVMSERIIIRRLAHRDFFSDEARARAAEAVKRVETQTSAEVVVTVRRLSDRYRDADTMVGTASAFAVLLLLLFLPQEFDIRFMPLDVVLAFFVGYVISTRSDLLRQLATRKSTRRDRVDTAAKAAFVTMGVSRTKARTGILVYVSMLEKQVDIVADIGLTTGALNEVFESVRQNMTLAVASRDFALFATALETLGPKLCTAFPCVHDDVNELSDEVRS